ncbi:MAG: toll/interleukin-1 receptor domain-containing protein [Anaerolineae bacterium]
MAKKKVFISYARTDMDYLERLRADFQQADIGVWIDHLGLQVGTPDWEDSIREALKEADAVILIASPNSRDSNFVRDEIAVASHLGKPVFPVWVHGEFWNDAIPLGRGMIQYADLRGEKFAEGVQAVIKAILNLDPTQIQAGSIPTRFVSQEIPQVSPTVPPPSAVAKQTRQQGVRAPLIWGAVLMTLIVVVILLAINRTGLQPDDRGATSEAAALTDTHTASPSSVSSSQIPDQTDDSAMSEGRLIYNAPVSVPAGWRTYTVNGITLSAPPELRETDVSMGPAFFSGILAQGGQLDYLATGLDYLSEHTRLYLADFLSLRGIMVTREDTQLPISPSEAVVWSRLSAVFTDIDIPRDAVHAMESTVGTIYRADLDILLGEGSVRLRSFLLVDGTVWYGIAFSYRLTDAEAWEPEIEQIVQTIQLAPAGESTESP